MNLIITDFGNSIEKQKEAMITLNLSLRPIYKYYSAEDKKLLEKNVLEINDKIKELTTLLSNHLLEDNEILEKNLKTEGKNSHIVQKAS